MNYRDIIIIGGGPAGLTAGLYAARAGMDVLLIEKMFAGGQIATTDKLENYPGIVNGISGPEFSMKMEEHARKFGLDIVYEDVLEYHLTGTIKKVTTDANQYQARAVILTMGANPRHLNIPGEAELSARGVSYCATCDGAFFKNKVAAVIGGGDTACEDAEYLSKLCKKVYIVHRRDQLRAVPLLGDRVKRAENIEILWNAVPEEITGTDVVDGVMLRNKVTQEYGKLDVDAVFVAIGSIPNTKGVEGQIRLSDGNYIETDNRMRTNILGVFAAGDIRTTPLRQVITACADGAVAAEAAREYINEHSN